MATAARIQDRIYYGYAQAAQHLGVPFAHYRPANPLLPIGAASLIEPARLASLVVNFDYAQPNKYGVATWKALVDGRVMAVGDYLIGATGTFFIAGMQPMLPILAVECNRTLTFTRAKNSAKPGVVGYMGSVQATETPVLTGWPSSVLEGTKGQATPANLPGDTRLPWWRILLPAIDAVELQFSDIATDDLGRRYVVSSAEQTDFGWRLTASQSEI